MRRWSRWRRGSWLWACSRVTVWAFGDPTRTNGSSSNSPRPRRESFRSASSDCASRHVSERDFEPLALVTSAKEGDHCKTTGNDCYRLVGIYGQESAIIDDAAQIQMVSTCLALRPIGTENQKPKQTAARAIESVTDVTSAASPPPPTGVLKPGLSAQGSGVHAQKGLSLFTFDVLHFGIGNEAVHVALAVAPQVQCKALVCPSSFKTQKFCEMLRELCPEMGTSPPGAIRSARCPMEMFSSKSRRR